MSLKRGRIEMSLLLSMLWAISSCNGGGTETEMTTCPPGTSSVTCPDCKGGMRFVACQDDRSGAQYQCPPCGDDCAQLLDETACRARGCHPVFEVSEPCGCPAIDCCPVGMSFSSCAAGSTADCTGANLGCAAPEPACSTGYRVAYAGQCYEGCVVDADCGR